MMRKLWLGLAVAGLVGSLCAPASAQGTIPNEPVYFTFSAPVSLPGMTLPAGEYEFRLANSQADRHIVQIYNRKDGKAVGMLFAIPAIRADVPEKPEIRFMETPSDMPPAVQTWWYPGITTGHEFIYPHDQAVLLAKVSKGKGVLTTKGEEKSGQLVRMTAEGESLDNAGAMAPP